MFPNVPLSRLEMKTASPNAMGARTVINVTRCILYEPALQSIKHFLGAGAVARVFRLVRRAELLKRCRWSCSRGENRCRRMKGVVSLFHHGLPKIPRDRPAFRRVRYSRPIEKSDGCAAVHKDVVVKARQFRQGQWKHYDTLPVCWINVMPSWRPLVSQVWLVPTVGGKVTRPLVVLLTF